MLEIRNVHGVRKSCKNKITQWYHHLLALLLFTYLTFEVHYSLYRKIEGNPRKHILETQKYGEKTLFHDIHNNKMF